LKILGFDTSTRSGSVAILENEELLAEVIFHQSKTHSERLLPSIKYLLQDSALHLDDMDAIAVTAGPGSFTGLRIGLSTLKGLGWALEKPLLGISTLIALAYNLAYSNRKICPLLDARKGEVYTALFHFHGEEIVRETDDMVIAPAELVEKIEGEIVFLGDGIRKYGDLIKKKMNHKCSFLFVPPALWSIRASNICRLGLSAIKKGEGKEAKEISLNYIRPSEAELTAATTP
jgi:tRNA threonylcarbamoyladenosine biosynthesis protein TsaB